MVTIQRSHPCNKRHFGFLSGHSAASSYANTNGETEICVNKKWWKVSLLSPLQRQLRTTSAHTRLCIQWLPPRLTARKEQQVLVKCLILQGVIGWPGVWTLFVAAACLPAAVLVCPPGSSSDGYYPFLLWVLHLSTGCPPPLPSSAWLNASFGWTLPRLSVTGC